MSVNRPRALLRFVVDQRGVPLETFDGRLPGDFEQLRVTIRRTDAQPCTATLSWRAPSVNFDQLFDFQRRIR